MDLMTIEQVADLLKVPRTWIYARTCESSELEPLPFYRFGRLLRFKRSEILAWAESNLLRFSIGKLLAPEVRTNSDCYAKVHPYSVRRPGGCRARTARPDGLARRTAVKRN